MNSSDDFKRRAALIASMISKPTPPDGITPDEAVRFVDFMKSEKSDCYFGRAFLLKAEILQHAITGKPSLSSIAQKHGVTPAACTRFHRKAREIFCNG